MRLRNIPRNIPIRTRRVINWRRNNAPFISGDFFADICDVSIYEPLFRFGTPTRKEIEAANSIFCPSHKWEQFVDEYGANLSATVLFLGNSDRDFVGPLTDLPVNFKTVYRQNSTFNNETYQILPIGLENIRLGQNGRKFLFESKYAFREKSNKLMIGPFAPTHSDRSFLLSLNSDERDPWTVYKGRIKPKDFAELSSTFMAVAAPRGNGLDTHRFWEALYRGSYPVVVKSSWSDNLESMGVPLISISDWNLAELNRVTELQLPRFNPRDIEILWTKFWEKKISFSG